MKEDPEMLSEDGESPDLDETKGLKAVY